MKPLLILPHQLFKINKSFIKINEIDRILLWEHPQYFTKYNYNKKRLVMHRASMKHYVLELKNLGILVIYYDYDIEMSKISKELSKGFTYFDFIDKINVPKIKKGIMIESPNFLLGLDDMNEYRKKTEHFIFNNFYMWSKKRLNVIPEMKSTDKDNRKKLPKELLIPKPYPSFSCSFNGEIEKNAVKYVKKGFGNNYGTFDDMNMMPPVCRKDAVKLLRFFINKKFSKFGDYQDAIDKNNLYLFHSLLSSSINIGLLNPSDIIKEVIKVAKKNKIPKNSLEGFIRQLFWREYQRYCYIYVGNKLKNGSFFGGKGVLGKEWYLGTVGVPIIDDCIRKAFRYGYLHHIERLMVMGNFMNLNGIKSSEGFRWFMEFSMDSYEWVMYQNVYDMVFFNTGGLTMRRPYVSSSNYILKMSNYGKGEWIKIWNRLYADFVKKHKKKLYKFRYYFPSLK